MCFRSHIKVVMHLDETAQVIEPITYPKECPTHTMEAITVANHLSGKIYSYSHHRNARVHTYIHCITHCKIRNYCSTPNLTDWQEVLGELTPARFKVAQV